jgi:DNA-binding XRE family transcriptional regulator
MFDRDRTGADAVFSRLRAGNPAIAETERALGSRLVVARNVLRLRIRCGFTQKRLAEELGISQPRVAQIEGAEANLQLDTLDRIAAVFGVEPATLLMKEEGAESHAEPPAATVPADADR